MTNDFYNKLYDVVTAVANPGESIVLKYRYQKGLITSESSAKPVFVTPSFSTATKSSGPTKVTCTLAERFHTKATNVVPTMPGVVYEYVMQPGPLYYTVEVTEGMRINGQEVGSVVTIPAGGILRVQVIGRGPAIEASHSKAIAHDADGPIGVLVNNQDPQRYDDSNNKPLWDAGWPVGKSILGRWYAAADMGDYILVVNQPKKRIIAAPMAEFPDAVTYTDPTDPVEVGDVFAAKLFGALGSDVSALLAHEAFGHLAESAASLPTLVELQAIASNMADIDGSQQSSPPTSHFHQVTYDTNVPYASGDLSQAGVISALNVDGTITSISRSEPAVTMPVVRIYK